MTKHMAAVLAGCLLLLAVGCSTEPLTPADAAGSIGAAFIGRLANATEAVVITEENDPNDMIGQMNGYIGGVVIKDNRLFCTQEEVGRDCGAFIEIWRDAKTAERRASYVRSVIRIAPKIMGEEYQKLRGNVLIRISGELSESEAQEYIGIFNSVVQG